MNQQDFLEKLFAGSNWNIKKEMHHVGQMDENFMVTDSPVVSISCDNIRVKDLIRNMDLLAKELHMEVETQAEDKARDYLGDDEGWKMAVESGNTELSKEDWIDMVINTDGLGSILNGYDGTNDDIELNGTDYFICRR